MFILAWHRNWFVAFYLSGVGYSSERQNNPWLFQGRSGAFTAIGGLLGLVVGLQVAARLTKQGAKTAKELKAEVK